MGKDRRLHSRCVQGLHSHRVVFACLVVFALAALSSAALSSGIFRVDFRDPAGVIRTNFSHGPLDTSNPFFQTLGTNGRSCVSCHQPSDAWSVTPLHIQARFDATGGTDPIFRPVDGATCPTADVSTVDARRNAYSLLLAKGLIRIDRPLPPNAEFSIVAIDDPYGCSNSSDVSVYRRPLPSTNLGFLSTVMWDGRETQSGQPIGVDLGQQAIDATLGHAQASTPPTPEQVQQIVNFETGLFTAQIKDNSAGKLNANGAKGGPLALSVQPFHLGINDPFGGDPNGGSFSPKIFGLFDAWANATGTNAEARRSIARGEAIFNSKRIPIEGVAGINDVLGVKTFNGFCGTCHDTPNVGDHSLSAPLNIGLTDASRRTPDLPLFTLLCNATGKIVRTTDPGRAMVTGKCADIGKFKGTILRGLAARAPYFHNGSAATLMDVVNFYDQRFHLHFSDQEKADLVAFLQSL